jgi:hypothetical protein
MASQTWPHPDVVIEQWHKGGLLNWLLTANLVAMAVVLASTLTTTWSLRDSADSAKTTQEQDAKRMVAIEVLRKRELEDLAKIRVEHQMILEEIRSIRLKVKGIGE